MMDLRPMQSAVASLTESLALIDEHRDQYSEPMQLLMQRGLIQAFEYTYSLSILMMTRHLTEHASLPDKRDLSSFEELIRVADEHQLLLSPFATWKAYRNARNLTSHTYDRAKADTVAATAREFEREAKHLVARLQEKGTK